MKVLGFLLVVLLVGCVQGFEDKTVTQYLIDAGYTTLVQLLGTAGLKSALQGPGPFTLFAPTDAAFSKLDNSTLVALANDRSALSRVLGYHVVSGFLLTPMVQGNLTRQTLLGEPLSLVKASTGNVVVDGIANVTSPADIVVNNGVVQPVDAVLMPPALPTENIAQVLIKQDSKFKDFFLALTLVNLTLLLETPGDFTVFAPLDTAFVNYRENLVPPGVDGTLIYKKVFEYHIVPGRRLASSLTNGQSLLTIEGSRLNVTVSAAGVKLNEASVVEADIQTSNGVIHAIDRIIIPPDIPTVIR